MYNIGNNVKLSCLTTKKAKDVYSTAATSLFLVDGKWGMPFAKPKT
jgi:hypothetical protein